MRATNGTIHKNRRKRLLKRAEGYIGGHHRLYRNARHAVMHAGQHAFASRRLRRREMRRLWIVRINAATRAHGISYSQFINMLKKADVQLNRKMLADLAFSDPAAFDALLESVRQG